MVRTWKVFIFTLLLSLPGLSAERICPESKNFKAIDFRSEFGPIRTQGGLNWCFAYAGSDLLTHWLFKRGEINSLREEDLVSATAMALTAHRYEQKEKIQTTMRIINQFPELSSVAHDPEDFIIESHDEAFDSGGFAANAAVSLAKRGICSEGRVRSSFFSSFELISRDLVQDVKVRPDKLKILRRITLLRDTEDAAAIQNLFSALSQNQIKKVLMTSKPEDAIFNLLDKSCEYRKVSVPTAKMLWLSDYPSRNQGLVEVFKTLDDLIEKEHAALLSTSGDIFDYADKEFDFEIGHAVIAVGKRFNCQENEPEYVLRNSWGSRACEKYLSDFRRYNPLAEKMTKEIIAQNKTCKYTCSKFHDEGQDFQELRLCESQCEETASTSLIKANKPPYYCEDGYYVMRKSLLEQALRGMSYLE